MSQFSQHVCVVNPDEVDYESAIENIYTVNPNLLVGLSDQAIEDIFEEFDRGFMDPPQITTAIYEWFNVDTDGGLDLRDKGDQEIFKWMFKNGKFKKITGEATVVRFVEFEYDTHYI